MLSGHLSTIPQGLDLISLRVGLEVIMFCEISQTRKGCVISWICKILKGGLKDARLLRNGMEQDGGLIEDNTEVNMTKTP